MKNTGKKKLTPARVFALSQAMFVRLGWAHACKDGHFDCSFRDRGPCSGGYDPRPS